MRYLIQSSFIIIWFVLLPLNWTIASAQAQDIDSDKLFNFGKMQIQSQVLKKAKKDIEQNNYVIVFFCGAGPVKIEECEKDANHFQKITKIPVKLFTPSAVTPVKVMEQTIRWYSEEDFNEHEEYIRTSIRSNPNTHYIFVASSKGWIPFSRLAPKLKDFGLADKNYDVILNQPAGGWASGILENKLPHKNFSVDNLPSRPGFFVILGAPDINTADSFDEILFTYKTGKYFKKVNYAPLTDLKEGMPLKGAVDKHRISTGAGLKWEVTQIICILINQFGKYDTEDKKVDAINTKLEDGRGMRNYYADRIEQPIVKEIFSISRNKKYDTEDKKVDAIKIILQNRGLDTQNERVTELVDNLVDLFGLYKLTEENLNKLLAEEIIPQNIIDKIKPLKDKVFFTEDEFTKSIKEKLEKNNNYISQILKNAEIDVETRFSAIDDIIKAIEKMQNNKDNSTSSNDSKKCSDGSPPPCKDNDRGNDRDDNDRDNYKTSSTICPDGSLPPCRCPDGSLPPCKDDGSSLIRCPDGSLPPCRDNYFLLRYEFKCFESVTPFLIYEPQINEPVIISK
ncbi:MAG: hypothetical protein HQK79_22095 [Desulfobacterales bacterium]|nr:hypothetical protein [Desulfobacterales bacterium]